MPRKNPGTFHILTFGCQMNARDSQWLAAMLTQRGFASARIPDADVIILNTCSVREKPEHKLRSALSRVYEETGRDPGRLVVVAGCVAQQLGTALYQASPQLRLIAGTDGMGDLPDAIEKLLSHPNMRLDILNFQTDYRERPLDQNPGASAWVTIMQGCDNFCSYCIVPFTRGRQKSRQAADILHECRQRLDSGAIELTLLGQNVNAYGKDLRAGGDAFYDLLRQIAPMPGLERLRYVAAHPRDMTEATVNAFAEFPAICPRLHLPLQSGSGKILRAMRRRHTPEDYLRLVSSLRRARPDIALSADIIVGFPGETETDFQETLAMMREAAFVSSFSFRYSDRPGTRSALMPDKIAEDVKRDRLLRLQKFQDELDSAWLASRVGDKTTVLLEGPSARNPGNENFWQGKDPYGATVNIAFAGQENMAGCLVEAEITASKQHTLSGKCLRILKNSPMGAGA